jgi:hypothetical protein
VRWLLHVREIDELGRMGSRGDRTDGGPGLADPAGTGQRHEPNIVAAQEILDTTDLAFSANKRRAGDRQSARFSVALGRYGENAGSGVAQRWQRHAAWHCVVPHVATIP